MTNDHSAKKSKGIIGEARFAAFAAGMGWLIYKGFSGWEPYDFIIDTHTGLSRVEVKRIESRTTFSKSPGHITYQLVRLPTHRFDYLFVSTPTGDYFIPSADVPKGTLSISTGGTGKYEVHRV